jgi:hypothetical protein
MHKEIMMYELERQKEEAEMQKKRDQERKRIKYLEK